ncbi:MAG: DUF2095 family protein [Candidatus Bathyarchaeia archaeon]
MNVDKNQFKKMFPNLAREMEYGESEISISSVRSNIERGEKASSERFEGYEPDVIDFLRRCDNEQQAEEIIEYLEKKKEIDAEYADRLRNQLRCKGVRSFGSKKEDAHYLKQAGF